MSQPQKVQVTKLLGKKHTGFRLNIKGGLTHMIKRAAVRDSDQVPFLTFLRDELTNIATSFYTGDLPMVDKGLQSFCLDANRPEQPEEAADHAGNDHENCPRCAGGGIDWDTGSLCCDSSTSQHPEHDLDLVRAVTKAILFQDCGNTSEWQSNTELGEAAIRAVKDHIVELPKAVASQAAFESGRQAAYDQMQNLISQVADATIYCMEISLGKLGDDTIPTLIKDHQRLRALAHPPFIIKADSLTSEQIELLRKSQGKANSVIEDMEQNPRWMRLRKSAANEDPCTGNTEGDS